jgi:hypothetical protein
MHPMFVTLFIETDAGDLLAPERDKKRHARAARRGLIMKSSACGMGNHS